MKRLWFAAAIGASALLSACVPAAPPSVPPPVIAAFSAVTPTGPSPVTTALTWSISDPGSGPLSCSLDLDGDGTADMSVADCSSGSLRTATFTHVGTNTVTLRVSNGSSSAAATTTVTVAAAGSDPFDIMLRLDPSIPPSAASLVEAAAARWEGVVRTGLPSATVSIPAGYVFASVPALDTTVDDVFVDVTAEPIDGPGSTVGLGGGFRVRPDGTTIYGALALDSDDLSNLLASPGWFVDTVTHEIGHVLANSEAWSAQLDATNPSDVRFVGPAANGIFQGLGGTGTIPVQNGHWSETVFGTELMTPAGSPGEAAPLSAMTVAALADMGYGVDLAGAEPYSLPTAPAVRAGGALTTR